MPSLRMGPAAGFCAITPSLFTTPPHERRHFRESGNPDLSPGSFYREVGRAARLGHPAHFHDVGRPPLHVTALLNVLAGLPRSRE